MSQLTLRLVKGEELTFSELDANFLSLDSDIIALDSLFGVVQENLDSDILSIKNDMVSFHTEFDSLIGILQNTVLMDSVRVIQIIDSYVDSAYFEQYADVINNLIDSSTVNNLLDSTTINNLLDFDLINSNIDSSTVINLLGGELVGGLTIDSVAPDANEGEMWLDTQDDQVYIWDGDAWFEFPGTADQYASVAIDNNAPLYPISGTLWLDKDDDIVKIYDGSVWFEWPYPDVPGVSDSELSSLRDSLQSNIDSLGNLLQGNIDSVYNIAIAHYEFDSVPVQAMIDSALSVIDGGTY